MKNVSDKLMYIGFLIFAVSVSISMSAQVLGVLIVLIGWIAGMFFEKRGFYNHRVQYYDTALFAFLAVLVLSTVFSININNSFRRLVGFIGEIAVYFAVLSFAWENKRLSKFVRIMVIFTLIESIYGIVQYFTGVSFLNYGEAKKQIHSFWRIFGTWDYYNSLGGILGMIIPVSIFAGIYSDTRNDRYLYFTSALIMIACLIFTSTRGAWLGVIFSVTVLSLVEKKKLLVIPLVLIAVLLVIPGTRNRMSMTLNFNNESSRLSMWKTAAGVMKHRPVLGTGLETFRDEFYTGSSEEKLFFHYHNIYLGLGAETGLIGLISFIVFSAGIVISGIKKLKYTGNRFSKGMLLGFTGTILCFLVHGLVDYNLRGNTVYLFWLACGLIVYMKPQMHTDTHR